MDSGEGRGPKLHESWEWTEFAAGLPAKPVPLNSITAGTLLYGGRCILMGGSVQNSGGGNGTLSLLDGVDATGMAVVILPLAAGVAGAPPIPASGVLMEIGVYAVPVTATIKGAVYVVPLLHNRRTPPVQ